MNARRKEPPLPPEAEAAIRWSIRLSSEDATDQDRAGFRDWLTQSSAHQRAWRDLASSMNVFEIAGRRQGRRGGFAARALRFRRSRRNVLRNLVGFGLVGAASASIVNRFVPLAELTAGHLTLTAQVKRVPLADGAAVVLGPRTGVDISRDGAVQVVSLFEGEIFVDAAPEALTLTMREMSLSAARGSFAGRRRGGRCEMFALDTPALVTCNGTTSTLEPGHTITFDGTDVATRSASAQTETGWIDGKLFADNESLGAVVDRMRVYFTGIIRVDPAVARLHVSGVFPLDDLDLAFATLARALDLSVTRVTPFWVSIGPILRRRREGDCEPATVRNDAVFHAGILPPRPKGTSRAVSATDPRAVPPPEAQRNESDIAARLRDDLTEGSASSTPVDLYGFQDKRGWHHRTARLTLWLVAGAISLLGNAELFMLIAHRQAEPAGGPALPAVVMIDLPAEEPAPPEAVTQPPSTGSQAPDTAKAEPASPEPATPDTTAHAPEKAAEPDAGPSTPMIEDTPPLDAPPANADAPLPVPRPPSPHRAEMPS